VLIVFTDDQGWADLGVQGAEGFSTPNLDQLAEQGQRFTHFRVPVAVCTPSRAALLTGRHPVRMGLGHRVIFPFSTHGMPAAEQTVAELLGGAGYRTAIVGKWHLGHAQDEFHPLAQGFDHWFGVPYSNDMDSHYYGHNEFQSPPLPLWRDREVIEEGPEQRFLTKRFTDDALHWIEHGGEGPWFLYLAHVMPHQPLSVSWEFAGKTPAGLYGDVINEIDDSVGRLMTKLDELGQADNTIVIFTSDNGPWRQKSSGPLRGRKNSTWEGGHRVPCVVRWPTGLTAGQVRHEPWSTLDLLPTLAQFCDAPRQDGLPLDGYDRSAWLRGEADHQATAFPYYKNEVLEAVEFAGWKLRFSVAEDGSLVPGQLFQLQDEWLRPVDFAEASDLSEKHPELVRAMLKQAKGIRSSMESGL